MKNLEPSAHKNISHCKYVHSMKLQTRKKTVSNRMFITEAFYINHQSAVNIEQRRDSYRPKYQTMNG